MIQLLTPQEVIKYANLSPDFPTCDIGDTASTVFEEFFKCLGIEFYDYIVSKLATYSYTNYNEGTAYPAGAVVTYNSVLWRAKVLTTDIAGNLNTWELAPKFTETCLNTFWCDYLAPYLSWVYRKSKTVFWFYDSKLTTEGYVKNAASEKVLTMLIASVDSEINRKFTIMDYYLRKHKTECGFSNYKPNQEVTDCGCDAKDSCATSKVINSQSWMIY